MKVDLPDTQKMGRATAGHAEKNFHHGRIFRVLIQGKQKMWLYLFAKEILCCVNDWIRELR